MTTDGITIKLGRGEHHALRQLLDRFIHESVWEAVKFARSSTELERAGQRAIRLGQLRDLAAEEVLRGDLDAHRTDLMKWLLEAEDSTEENDKTLAELEESDDRGPREESIQHMRDILVQDYAHRCVCEKIVGEIDGARELVPA
jgi:hypothetical protein